MAKKKVFYLARYARTENGELINDGSLAATRKLDYIAQSISKCGYEVEIVSVIRSKQKFQGISSKKTIKLSENISLTESPSIGETDNPVLSKIRNILSKAWLLIFMLVNIKKNDTVVIYHDYVYASQILLAYRIKKFRAILEIEDIYQKVWNIRGKDIVRENRVLETFHNDCIVASDTIKNELNISNAVVAYGNYKTYKGDIKKKGQGNKIKVICTGSIDRARGIGIMSAEVADILNNRYQVFISGPITDDCKEEFLNKITAVNNSVGYEKCRYLGILDDEEYEELLLDADIALNPQKQGDFDKYVFPSKILTYLGYNLDVVTTPGESIVKSKVKEVLSVTKGYTPQDLVDEIEKVRFDRMGDYREYLTDMSKEFIGNLSCLLENTSLKQSNSGQIRN